MSVRPIYRLQRDGEGHFGYLKDVRGICFRRENRQLRNGHVPEIQHRLRLSRPRLEGVFVRVLRERVVEDRERTKERNSREGIHLAFMYRYRRFVAYKESGWEDVVQ